MIRQVAVTIFMCFVEIWSVFMIQNVPYLCPVGDNLNACLPTTLLYAPFLFAFVLSMMLFAIVMGEKL